MNQFLKYELDDNVNVNIVLKNMYSWKNDLENVMLIYSLEKYNVNVSIVLLIPVKQLRNALHDYTTIY